MKAMILAAGLGTRLKPWTDNHPKALAIVNGKTLLQRNIEYLQQAGIFEVVVNVHHFSEQILKSIDENNGWGSKISISDESEEILETGGGLKKAAGFFAGENELILMNVDILTDMSLSALIKEHDVHDDRLATLAVSQRESSRYLIFDKKNGLLGGWENIKTEEKIMKRFMDRPIQRAFSGIHCIDTRLFEWMDQEGKFSIIDTYLSLCATQNISYYDHTGCRFIDVGKPENLLLAEQLLK